MANEPKFYTADHVQVLCTKLLFVLNSNGRFQTAGDFDTNHLPL